MFSLYFCHLLIRSLLQKAYSHYGYIVAIKRNSHIIINALSHHIA